MSNSIHLRYLDDWSRRAFWRWGQIIAMKDSSYRKKTKDKLDVHDKKRWEHFKWHIRRQFGWELDGGTSFRVIYLGANPSFVAVKTYNWRELKKLGLIVELETKGE